MCVRCSWRTERMWCRIMTRIALLSAGKSWFFTPPKRGRSSQTSAPWNIASSSPRARSGWSKRLSFSSLELTEAHLWSKQSNWKLLLQLKMLLFNHGSIYWSLFFIILLFQAAWVHVLRHVHTEKTTITIFASTPTDNNYNDNYISVHINGR